MMLTDDLNIIDSILKGNTKDYTVLVNKYKDLAFTISYRLLNNREDAEEVIQDSFVKAFKSLRTFRRDSKFSTWLYRIVYNASISKKRLKKKSTVNIDEMTILSENEYQTGIENEIFSDNGYLLEKAMKKLSEEERVLLTLFYINESSVDDIQIVTGLTKSNIKVKLFRARKKMYDLLINKFERIYV